MPENFDYAALATARSSTKIEGYDMITAVTQNAVNRELAKIWMKNESVRSLKITVTNSKNEIIVLMESEMDVPKVQFQLGINNLSVVYFLKFKKGSFKWYNEAESKTETIEMENWTLAFEVKLNLHLHDEPTDDSALVKYLKDNGVGEPGNYYVMQLFIDFTTADLMNYRKKLSSLPALASDSGRSVDDIASIRATFVNRIMTYLETLKMSPEGHPHTIYNIPKFKDHDVYHTPSIPPTSLAFQCYPFKVKSGDPNNEASDLNVLLYLEMTEKRDLPGKQLSTSANWVVPLSANMIPDGAVAISRRVFFERWLIPKLKVINQNTDVSVKTAYVDVHNSEYRAVYDFTDALDQSYDYNFIPSKDNPRLWEFKHTTAKQDSDTHTEMKAETEVKNSVSVDAETPHITLKGFSKAQVYVKFKDNEQGATIWATMTWEKVFSFSVDSKGQLKLTLNEKPISKDDHKDPLPAGDAGIKYYHGAQTTSNPSYFVQQDLPSEHLDKILKSLQSVFQNKWAFFFAGDDVFSFKHVTFNNEGDLLLDAYYF